MKERMRSIYHSSKIGTKIVFRRLALRLWPKQFGRADLLASLANILYNRFEERGTGSDLDEALSLQRSALELRPQGHPLRVLELGTIASYFHSRFEQLGTLSDLDEAIDLARSASELYSQEHPYRDISLAILARYLHSRFEQLGTHADLDEAIDLARSASELCSQDRPFRDISLTILARYLHSRFEQFGTLSDLDEAIALDRNALELSSQEEPNLTFSLLKLARYHYDRFMQLGNLSDLDETLILHRRVLDLRPEGHPDRASSLSTISNHLVQRFTQLARLSDLEEALTLEYSALELHPQGDPDRSVSLGNIASCLHVRFQKLGRLSDLEEAITLQRDALELRPEGHPFRDVSLGSIAIYLHLRFTKLGILSDIDEALVLQRSALELRPQGHPNRAISLTNIASCLRARFNEYGMLSDLDEAISLERNALELRPEGHPHRALSLGNLAIFLHDRFLHLGTLSDLDEALALERKGLELRRKGHPDEATSLGNIAKHLHARFTQHGALSDLDEALVFERRALELRPHGHPNRDFSLASIAKYLHARFTQRRMLPDLDDALALERDALELRPHGHPHRATSLSNIALYLSTRFVELESPADLEEALALERSALELCPQGHPHWASSLSSLASYFHNRSKHSVGHSTSDLQETFDLYSQLSQLSDAVSLADLKCVKHWIQAAEECKHSTAVLAYETFLRLTVQHFATLPSLPQHLALLKRTTTSIALDAFSACVRDGNLAKAIELLEQGRGVFWNQLIRLRSPLDEVIASGDAGKRLADEFTRLSSQLRSVLDATSGSVSQHDRACRLSIQLQDIATEIRKLPGLSRFLLPPLFSDLQIAASCGPVIIVNASQYGCDALIVLANEGPVHIALPSTKSDIFELSLEIHSLTLRARFNDVMKECMVFLRKLWDALVRPIVEVLEQFCPRRSRVWWCPTAEFSLLPLHAAGPFRKGQPMFSDLYISSYTPTLTALVRARSKRQPTVTEPQCFLVVGQAQAPGQRKLDSVNTELSKISQQIESVAAVTCIRDLDASIANVAQELRKCQFVHLACHGVPNQGRPFESGFALGDGKFNIEHIMQYDLQSAEFAYLSACHTTVGDKESPDEVIHLAAAMQFAGFRSVIGTMWAVDDAHTNEITSKFYEYMLDESGRLDHTRAALALHRTMRSLRSSKVPLDQRMLYVHIGA